MTPRLLQRPRLSTVMGAEMTRSIDCEYHSINDVLASHEGSAMYPPNTAIPIFLHLLSPQSIKPNKKIQQTNIEMEHLSKPPPGAPRKSNHPPRIILSPVARRGN
eukprot:scaffold4254_cov136-Skeletonema_marinoi.AAC.5